jgi:hypothetical protein
MRLSAAQAGAANSKQVATDAGASNVGNRIMSLRAGWIEAQIV